VKPYTRYAAYLEATRCWGTPGTAPGDRYGLVSLRRKNVADRYEVGYCIRGGDGHNRFQPVVMGRGPSWEAAFVAASRQESGPTPIERA